MFEIAQEHPEYGYRRTTPELKERGHPLSRKVVQRLHWCWELSLVRRVKKPGDNPVRTIVRASGARANLVTGLKTIGAFDVLYTDFTEIRYQRGLARAHLMPLVDHGSRLVMGHALGERANTALALAAWQACTEMMGRLGRTPEGIIVHHDQDGVYLGYGWLYRVVVKDTARVSYSENGAKGNVQMESFNGRFKEENRLLFWEQEDFSSLQQAFNERIRYYNYVRRHSALDNRSPINYLKEKGLVAESVDSGN